MDKTLQLKVIAALQDKLSGPLSRMRGASGKTATSMKELRERLKGLESTQREVGRFRELSRGLGQTSNSLEAAQNRVAELARAIRSTDQPTAAMRREFNQAVRAARNLKDEHKQQSQSLQGLRDRLNAAGLSTRKLGGSERELRSSISRTNEQLEQQRAKLGQVARQQRRLNEARDRYGRSQQLASNMAVGGAASFAAGSGALYAGARTMAPGVQFDADMSQVQALTRLKKDSAELLAIREQARKLGADTMFSATESAQGQGYLAMAGFDPQAILDAMPGMLDLAKAGGNELAETADIASNILTGFDLAANQMGRVGDVLVGTFTRSNTNLAMLGETMKYAAPIASSLGQDIETVAAMAGKLGDAGIQGGMGGTALRAILNRLSAPPKAAADALDTLGISAADADGNLRSMPELLQEVYERTKKMGEVERAGLLKGLAGEEAVSALQVLVKQAGSGDLQNFIDTLRQAQDEAGKTAAIMGDNLIGDLDQLGSAWEDLGIQLQEQENGPMRETVVMVADIVGSVKEWIAANPELTSTLVKVAAVMALVIAAGGAITIGLASILGPLAMLRYGMAILSIRGGGLTRVFSFLGRTVLPLVGKSLIFIGRALMMNPIGLAIAAIALAAYLVYRYWEPIKAFFGGLWAEIKAAFDGGIAGIAALIVNWSPVGLFYKAFAAVMDYFGVELPTKFTEFGAMLVSGLINGIRNMAGSVKETVTGLGSDVMGWFKDKLGISSPSRVFIGFGENVSEGAAQGIARSRGLAAKAAKMMAAGVMSAGVMSTSIAQRVPPINFDTRPDVASQVAGERASSSIASGQVTIEGDRVEIHIHAAPGMNPQDIGRAVAAELDRREREKHARARSALSDYGN
tara:strand:+ start:4412 stop:7003 length:2592 start_codon:yes stop_codon:yes gene_type:complete